MPSIYFAGPDVFSADYHRKVKEIKTLCKKHSITPLIPGDPDEPGIKDSGSGKAAEAKAIYSSNVSMILSADGVIANLRPFRGAVEPDSGTSFEVGFAAASGKWIVAYLEDHRSLPERVKDSPLKGPDGKRADRDGWLVEDFGLPVNLMLYCGSGKVVKTLPEAVAYAVKLMEKGMIMA
jgi:nucleoside 2-deoxyribosyltransferase